MNAPYEQDRRVLAYLFAGLILALVGYLGFFRPEAVNPTIAALIVSIMVVVLALVGVRNPMKEHKDEPPTKSYLERLAGSAKPDGDDEGETHRSGRSDRNRGLRWHRLPDPTNQCA